MPTIVRDATATASTPDQTAADKIGRNIDQQIEMLQDERAALRQAADRIIEIDAELAVLVGEKQKIDPRRPPQANVKPAVDVTQPVRVK